MAPLIDLFIANPHRQADIRNPQFTSSLFHLRILVYDSPRRGIKDECIAA